MVKARLAAHEGVKYAAELAITPLVFDTAFTFPVFYIRAITIRTLQAHNNSVLTNAVSLKRVIHAKIPLF